MPRSPARRRKPAWRTITPDPAKVGPLLREAGFLGSEGDPVECRASFDGSDRPRRIHARYADGWRCTMTFRADGSYSLSQAITLRSDPRPSAS
jgi:hypothetical protein